MEHYPKQGLLKIYGFSHSFGIEVHMRVAHAMPACHRPSLHACTLALAALDCQLAPSHTQCRARVASASVSSVLGTPWVAVYLILFRTAGYDAQRTPTQDKAMTAQVCQAVFPRYTIETSTEGY